VGKAGAITLSRCVIVRAHLPGVGLYASRWVRARPFTCRFMA
jgi:hypothetical protein